MMESKGSPLERSSAGGYNPLFYDGLQERGVQDEITSPVGAGPEATPYEGDDVVREPAEAGEEVPATEYRAPRSTLPVLPLAEQLGPDPFRARLEQLKGDRSHRGRMETASVLAELALATPNDREAAAAFDTARAINADIIAEAPPYSEGRLAATRQALFIPLLRMRRQGADPVELSDAAYEAYARVLEQEVVAVYEILHKPASAAGEQPTIADVNPHLVSGVAADTVGMMLARRGRMPYVSSQRERYDIDPGRTHNVGSDIYMIENGYKIPIKVRFNANPPMRPDDRTQVAVVKYIRDICRPVARDLLPGNQKEVPQDEPYMGIALSSKLVREARGMPVPKIRIAGRQFPGKWVIDLATRRADNLVKEWYRERQA